LHNYFTVETNKGDENVMEKKIINSKKIPAAIGPYSPAIKVGKLLFISGQVAIDPESGITVKGDIRKQTKQILENLTKILGLYSLDLKNVVKTTVFLKDMNDFSEFNKVYAEYFTEEFPARSCVEVLNLPNKDSKVEIEAIAICD